MNHNKKNKAIKYKPDDMIIVVDPFSPFEDQLGVIQKADNKRMRYIVKFANGYQDSFWYHQIKPYRTKEELEALIDLSLALGSPAKWMFDEWIFELKCRFPQ